MNGDRNTAPVSPPPGPAIPGMALFGPAISPQHAVLSACPSSNRIITRPSCLYAGEARILGIQVERKALMPP